MRSFIRSLSFILLLISMVSFNTQAQNKDLLPDLKFTRLSLEEGLSNTNITSIVQDYQGFIWISTYGGGINRFDGYDFKIYKLNLEDKGSLSNDAVLILYEDSFNNLWVGTNGGGLNLYDRTTDSFIHYPYDSENPSVLPHANIKSFYESKEGILWVGSDGGLSKFIRETGEFFTYTHDPDNDNSLSNDSVRAIAEDRTTGLLWLGTRRGGVTVFNRETEQFTRFEFNPDDPTGISNNAVTDIFQDSDDNIWITTRHGLNRFDRETKSFIRYFNNPDDPDSLSESYAYFTFEDSNGRFWVGTQEGLNLFNPGTGTFKCYVNKPNNPDSISVNNVATMMEDNTGALWFGTGGGGLNRLAGEPEKFAAYRPIPDTPNSLTENSVRSFYVDQKDNVWIGTEDGLHHFDGKTFTLYAHDSDDPNSINPDDTRSIIEDPKGGIWIATGSGLYHFNGQVFTHYEHDPQNSESINGNRVNGLALDNHGGLWISIHGIGVDYFDGQSFTHYIPDKTDPTANKTLYPSEIFKDPNGEIFWFLATGDGLMRLEAETNTFTNFLPAPDQPENLTLNDVSDFYYDENGMIWLGGHSGLILFDPATEKFMRHYTKNDGLPDNGVTGIIGDNLGQLWVSTQNGLSRFDPQNKTFRNYNITDGLLSNQFIQNAIAKMPDGQILLGSSNGINTFYPDQVEDNPNIPPVVLTGFELFNQSPVIAAKDSPLKQAIGVTDELVLSYDQSVFTFEFAALNYSGPEKNQYAYIMEGFDSEWLYTTSDRRFATYTNLNPGQYTFRVKASNNDGIWNEKGVSLPVTITPPLVADMVVLYTGCNIDNWID